MLATMPFMFAIQQACEGIQWLYLGAGSSSLAAGYGFLFFALIAWPIYTPLFVLVLDRKKRKIMSWFLALGTLVAAYFVVLLATQPLAISELRSCVSYHFNFPYSYLTLAAYVVAVLGPLLASSKRIFNWFGMAVAALALVSLYFYTEVFTSVWCFFSAAVSSMFFGYVLLKKRG